MTEPVDWSKPIQTVDGQPAKLVHTINNDRVIDPHLVVIDEGQITRWIRRNGSFSGHPFIRNVPERVKLEGWIAVGDKANCPGAPIKTSLCYPTRERLTEACGDIAYAINLALVSEKCPEAIERVK